MIVVGLQVMRDSKKFLIYGGKKMSMNLHCEGVSLKQTPTYISYMCYSNGDGGSKGILYRYEQWLWYNIGSVFENREDYDEEATWIKEHLGELNRKLDEGGLDFSVW